MTLTIGDSTRDGLYQITDTAADHNYFTDQTVRVTVREMVGQPLTDASLAAMRRLAFRAVDGGRLSSRTLRTWWAGGQSHATFAITRLS
jgi:hypothetical protein